MLWYVGYVVLFVEDFDGALSFYSDKVGFPVRLRAEGYALQTWEEHNQQGRSAIGIPLISCDRVIGVLTLVRDGDDCFTNDDLNMVMRATNLIEQPAGGLEG